MSFDIQSTLKRLSAERSLFHSEADFQHALAWRIQSDHENARVRLEYRPFPGQSTALDLLVGIDDKTIAIELKHLTRALDVVVGDERFVLKDQGAHDISAYDCCKDLERLEAFVRTGVADFGYFVVLSNDPLYWKAPSRAGAGYDAFRIFDGRVISGALTWGDRAGRGTRRGREAPIVLSGSYELSWQDYSQVGPGPSGHFRCLVVDVGDGGGNRQTRSATDREGMVVSRQGVEMGNVELAIRTRIQPGEVLRTPTKGAPFTVAKIDSGGIVLLLGKGEWPTRLTWGCLEGIIPYIRGHGGVVDIGGRHEVEGRPGTLDGYLKTCVKRTTAGWVAVVLEKAGLLEILHERPARVRLS